MADGLLNKASIILTPTGYKAGTLYNVAPVVEPYEDFDFARASVASRVNSSGLVEMVGRTLGSELVTNGDFSNGTTDWTNASSDTFEVVDGGVGHSTSLHIEVSAVNRGAYQSVFVADKTYYVSLDLKVVSGSVYIGKNTRKLNNQNYNNSDWQTITGYLVAIDDKIRIYGNEASEFYVDNVSVKEVIDTNNIPRISYDSNGDNGHILLEPTSTNLIPYSENFEGGSWTNESIGTTPTLDGGYAAPDGSNSAYKISNANQDSFWYYPNVSDTNYARTIWARTVSGTGTAQLTSHNSNTNNTFNLTETWQRFEVNSTTSATGEQSFYAVDFRGSGTLTELLVWGAQSEDLSYATSYIPTLTGSTETRATETANGAGSAELINSTVGVLYAEIAALDDSSISIGMCDGSTDNRVLILLQSNNTIRGFVESSDTIVFDEIYQVSSTLDYHKIAIKYKANDFALWIDGVERDTDTNGAIPIGLNELLFNNGGGGSAFYGKCKALAVFNEALSDSELNNLTG